MDIVQVLRCIAVVAAALVAIGALVGLGGWLSTQFLLRRVHDIRYYAIGVRTIVVAGLALAAVWAAGPFGLGEPLRTQLTVSAGAWAVLTILLYLDPSSSRQLAALRDALPHGKGKE
jgi:hypothetical protein